MFERTKAKIRLHRICKALGVEPYEKLYPGYFLADAGAWHNDVNGGKYIVARFYRRDGVFIKPKRRKRK